MKVINLIMVVALGLLIIYAYTHNADVTAIVAGILLGKMM